MMNDVAVEIDAIRKEWGDRLLILGHHYQQASVLRHADETGDSLELSRKAAAHTEAERIVFCGVKFMAESADILTGPTQSVYMPDMQAGCPMARMADAAAMQVAWDVIGGPGGDWLPVVYVNSTADIKACCGRWGGSTCTSSNASKIFDWVLSQGKRVLFLPDEHLGRNTADDLGIDEDRVVVYDAKVTEPAGGVSAEDIDRARIMVWKGFCLVHAAFTVGHVREVRERIPSSRIIVHPEVPCEVVQLCDAHGSTSQIIKYVEAASAGSTIVIGTELNLVERLARAHAGRITVKALSQSVCANMAKTTEANLLALLREWPGRNEVHVPSGTAVDAEKALTRMLRQ